MSEFVEFMRNGRNVWPYCAECGCRLQIKTTGPLIRETEAHLAHFGLDIFKDARGCKCSKLFRKQIVPLYKVEEFV